MRDKVSYKIYFAIIISFIFFIVNFGVLAQETISTDPNANSTQRDVDFNNNNSAFESQRTKLQNGMLIYFKNHLTKFKRGEVISNVLCIKNQNNTVKRFSVHVSAPLEWQPFNRRERIWEVQPGDSIFIPVRLFPKNGFTGSTKYMFSAFLHDERDNKIGYAMFMAQTDKVLNWDFSISDRTVYLLRDQDEVNFHVNFLNKGYESQDIQLQAYGLGNNFEVIDTTTNKSVINNPITFSLDTDKDTSINFMFKERIVLEEDRFIDLEEYNPYMQFGSQRYSIHFRSISPNPTESKKFQNSDKIDFVRLAHAERINPYSSSVFPVVLDMHTANILGHQPIMNVRFYGSGKITENSGLYYNVNMPFSSSILGNSFERSSFNFGYYNKRLTLNAGNISSGLIGSRQRGKGIRAQYRLNRYNTVGAFYTQGHRFFASPDYLTGGVFYRLGTRRISFDTRAGHSINRITGTTSNIINLNSRLVITSNHAIGFRGGFSENTYTTNEISQGYYYGGNYSGSFFNRVLSTNLSATYYSPEFGHYSSERFRANHQSSVRVTDNFRISLRNNYHRYNFVHIDTVFNYFLRNQMNFIRSGTTIGTISPLIFYNISNISNFEVHSRGAGFNFSNFDFMRNVRYFINLQGGYNRAIYVEKFNRFFLQTSGYVQYKTWSFMCRYNLGNFSFAPDYYFYNSARNPQIISVSLRKQYVLPIIGWVTQAMVNYSHSTVSGNNVSFYPEIYYFSRGGWRFNVFAQWNLHRGVKDPDPTMYLYQKEEHDLAVNPWTGHFYLGAGLRKEFGIPIPGTKNDYATVEFIVFYDIDGTGVYDERNDFILDNMVVRLNNPAQGTYEVMTNEDGKCMLINMPCGSYKWSSFSLDNLYGWFANIPDSIHIFQDEVIYIPYTRGVHISGTVYVELEEFSIFKDVGVDVSNIMIFAKNHNKSYTTITDNRGNFSFYLPQGTYTISLDESILGQRFYLLQNDIVVEIDDDFDNIFIAFYILEQRRRIRMDNGR